jgi:hypothetical protein
MCGVDVPEEERKMEIKDLYDRMQDDSFKGVFGNTVSMEEFFKYMNDFRYRLNKKYLGGREISDDDKVKALKKRIANDAHMAGKIDTDGDGNIDDQEIGSQRKRIDDYVGTINMRRDMEAFNAVKVDDIELRKYLVQKYMNGNPRFKDAEIVNIEEENDEIRFYIMCGDGTQREFVPHFNKGKNGVLDYMDNVEKMVLNINELNTMLDKHDRGL